MSSNEAVGAAPLVAGIVLASYAARAMVQSGVSFWSVAGLVGGCAAVLVGLGTLLERGGSERVSREETHHSRVVLALAAGSIVVGAGVAIV